MSEIGIRAALERDEPDIESTSNIEDLFGAKRTLGHYRMTCVSPAVSETAGAGLPLLLILRYQK